ncbi:40S ribosomal protein S27-2-like [Cucumis melo var. makuwa]|uniref:40S ribosomal protein S27-2-like n=1 Tax=Cucumis melo var. makuwa TaxID=1194695 RepID=A0A5A7VE59_CUCMM|nr:40S ribosomal protein S27-2-like [Cucumis melo var. makuwa]TYK02843.1 40S ribosomal protein S27-2-like [Cucumis melo var. makuwa]
MFLIVFKLPSVADAVLQNDIDLLNSPTELEKRKHKLKRLVQSLNSFMDVKCQGCFTLPLSPATLKLLWYAVIAQTLLCQPMGGRARLTEWCSFRRKDD